MKILDQSSNSSIKTKLQKTKLQKGDHCVWRKKDGTVAFHRDGTPLRRSDNEDDKFLIEPTHAVQFHNLCPNGR